MEASKEPYTYKDPQFRLVKKDDNNLWFDQSDLFIQHGNKTFLRVPEGKYAKIWIGSKAQILFSQEEPYEFDTPLFKLEQDGNWLKNQTDPYIKHGTQHIIRVPDGKIAKVWIGSEARLLEASKDPYKFDDPSFRLEENQDKFANSIFFDATSRLIQHGSIKRVIPKTNEVAITFDNGTLKIYKPLEDKKPHLITSPTHEVSDFLETSIRTIVFPSEEEMKKGIAENLSPDEVKLVTFTTRDSLKIGVKILVAFSIMDPELALIKLKNIEGILLHIENIAKVDMGKAIQKCTSQQFLSSYQTKPESSKMDSTLEEKKSVRTYQDEVRDLVAKDLKEYGIELIRLNIETPKILNQKIANEMEQASVESAKANANEGVLEQSYRIAQRTAQQEAEKKRIEKEQENNAQVSQAQAELNTEKLKAEARIVQAKAENEAIILRAEAEQQAMLMKAKAEAQGIELKAEAEAKRLNLMGQVYRDCTGLLELDKLKAQVKTLEKVSFNVTSSDFAQLRNNFGLFSSTPSLLSNQPRQGIAQDPIINILEASSPSGLR